MSCRFFGVTFFFALKVLGWVENGKKEDYDGTRNKKTKKNKILWHDAFKIK